jgi:uncharacterized protein (TIGR03000 family)
MYSIVLAIVVAGSAEVPDFGHRHGRHGGYGSYSSGYVCPPVYYGCAGYSSGGWISYPGMGSPGGGMAAGGAGGQYPSPGGGMGAGASGGQYPSPGGERGGQETERSLAELKKEIESLKKEQDKRQIEGLKSKIEELRAEKTEQKIDELRRAIERLHGAPHGGMRMLPHPLPRGRSPLPPPKSSPELPSPRQAVIHLQMPAGATLFVNGKQLDPAPTFLTPELEPDKDYDYEFQVKMNDGGKDTTRGKRVSVRAGSVIHVAFEDTGSADKPPAKQAKEGSADKPPAKQTKEAPAHITVRLPEDAELYVHGVYCPLTSDSRSFDTPKLEPGRRYLYILRAEMERDGRKVTQTRRVVFRAGEDVTVNIDESDSGDVTGG